MFTMSGGLKGISKLKGTPVKQQNQSQFYKLNESIESRGRESLASSFRFDQSWTEITKFKDIMSLISQHKEYERKEKQNGNASSDIEDFLIYQLRVKSETDDYLGIFRVLTIFEIRGAMVLGGDRSQNQEEQSQKSSSRVMMSPLASFEKTNGEGSSISRLSQMPQRMLRVISELVNRNEYTNDLQESLFEGKNLLFVDLKGQDAIELASMSGALMEI